MSNSPGVHRSIDPPGVMPQTARRLDPLAVHHTTAPQHTLSFEIDASREKMCNDRTWNPPRSDAMQKEAH
jgi:hypothetical protein